MDKFETWKSRKEDADVHTSSECDFDCSGQPPDSGNSDIATAFPNLAKVAVIVSKLMLPVRTATVERSFGAWS